MTKDDNKALDAFKRVAAKQAAAQAEMAEAEAALRPMIEAALTRFKDQEKQVETALQAIAATMRDDLSVFTDAGVLNPDIEAMRTSLAQKEMHLQDAVFAQQRFDGRLGLLGMAQPPVPPLVGLTPPVPPAGLVANG